ncbi:thermonuclease [Staphylococcus saccharolyticus]|uniref:Thermonuclease n=1 Tax=Staphylococcus saccharolyticus TaxID=33028 RepID=A0A380H7A7_9STAP|nr:thermonuclease [Staphylococcus saccharolyticus]
MTALKSKKVLSIIIVAMIAILVIIFQFINHSGPFGSPDLNHTSENSNINGKDKVYIKRVVDGDTFVAQRNNKDIKVRLIGIDTPETVKPNTPVQPYGKEASNYTKKHLTKKMYILSMIKKKQIDTDVH